MGSEDDHLGNVLATVLDRKTGEGTDASSSLYDHWSADLASTADYYPGGMMMPGRNTEYSWSRMGYNGKLKDDEVYGKGNLIDMGDRHLDTRILRTPRTDEKATKYPHMSPYSYANNNPIAFVDPNGKENVIYLVVLPSANAALGESKISANDIAIQANQNFKNMGLNTRVVVFDGGAGNFDITKIDAHDAVAVLGSKTNTITYVANQLKDPSFANELKSGFGGYDHPEKSENSSTTGYPQSSDNIIAIDADALWGASVNFQLNDESNPVLKTAGILINHGAGHNATRDHNNKEGQNSVIMDEGDRLGSRFVAPGKYEDVTTNAPSGNGGEGRNSDYVGFMKLRFGTEKAKNNYPGSKAPVKE